MILKFDRDVIFEDEELAFQGLSTDRDVNDRILSNFESFKEVRRGDAEENPEWKQPIPYIMIRQGDDIFTYRRLGGSGESRLLDKLSIGVGGHMNAAKVGPSTWDWNLRTNLLRELHEELIFQYDTPIEPKLVGLINDDSDPVGEVHIGVLMIIDIPEGHNVYVRETEVLEGSWVNLYELISESASINLENWSRLALRAL